MSLTPQDRRWHEAYQHNLSPKEVQSAREVFRESVECLRTHGHSTALDDRAESLIASITRYLIESRQ